MTRVCIAGLVCLVIFISLLHINTSANAQSFLFEFGTSGIDDGQSRFPHGIALDSSANIYVTDGGGNQRVQVFDSSGDFLFKFGSQGIFVGQFRFPHGIALDSSRNIYIADESNNRVQVFDSSGAFLFTFLGLIDSRLNNPTDVALDGSGNIYVVDKDNDRVQVFDSSGDFLFKFGNTGSGDGQFFVPFSVTLDGSGKIYVLDAGNNRVQVFDSSGDFLFKFGSEGNDDGQFRFPHGIALDSSANIYVTDSGNNRVQVFDSSGNFLFKFGTFGSGNGQFNRPWGVDVDSLGNIYVVDTDNDRIQVFSGLTPTDKDIVLQNVNITQAVSNPDVGNNGTFDLVLNRKTAILVNAKITGLNSQQVTIKASLLNQSNNVAQSVSKTFPANSEQPFELFFTPEAEGEFNLVVEADPDNQIDEDDEDNNSLSPIPVTVHATKQLVIPFVPINDCTVSNCYGPVVDMDEHMIKSIEFMQATYPVPDNGIEQLLIQSPLFGESLLGDSQNSNILGGDETSIIDDLLFVKELGALTAKAAGLVMKRVVGVVPEGYFKFHGGCCDDPVAVQPLVCERCVRGYNNTNITEMAVLVQEGFWSAAAHEIGHTYKLGHDFVTDGCTFPGSEGAAASGYFVSMQETINDALDFMGTVPYRNGSQLGDSCPSSVNNRWVSTENWQSLMETFAQSPDDPELINITFILNKDGSVELRRWFIFDGIPESPKPGPYTLELLDRDGLSLIAIPFDFVFSFNVVPFGDLDSNVAGISYAVPYHKDTALVRITNPGGTTLFEVDPVIKLLKDFIEKIPDQCFINGSQQRQLLYNQISAIEQLLKNGSALGAVQLVKEELQVLVNDELEENCVVNNPIETTKETLLELIQKTIPRLETRIDPDSPQPTNPPPSVNPPKPDIPGGGNTPDPVIKLNQLDIPSIPDGGEGVLVLNLTTDKTLNDVEIQIQANGLTPTGVEVGDTLQTTKAVTGTNCNIEGDIITCAIGKIEDEASLSVGLKANDGVTGTRQVSVDLTSNELENVVRFLFSVIVQSVSEPPPDDGGGNNEASNNGGCSMAAVDSKPRLELALLLPLFILVRRRSGIIRRIRRTIK